MSIFLCIRNFLKYNFLKIGCLKCFVILKESIIREGSIVKETYSNTVDKQFPMKQSILT